MPSTAVPAGEAPRPEAGGAKVVPLPSAKTTAPAAAKPPRDMRIDVIRGIALAMIYIDHVPGTIFEEGTSRNFGFSDAAEIFVLISGVSAALAYSRGMAARPLWPGVAKIWSRVWTLYLIQILISVWAMAVVSGVLHFGGIPDMLGQDNFQVLVRDPIQTMIGLPVMLHQFGYVNILPLYAVLLFFTPLILLGIIGATRATLAVSILAWVISGLTWVSIPQWPAGGKWFFSPLSWQLIFTIGLITGYRLKQGKRWIPVRWWLVVPAAAYAVMALVWVNWPAFASFMNDGMVWIDNHGAPRLVVNFDKMHLAVPRLLHILSLAYLVSCIPNLNAIFSTRWFAPLAVMGRQALGVFALGTIMSFAARGVKEIAYLPSTELDAVLVIGGLGVLWAFAWIVDTGKRKARVRAS